MAGGKGEPSATWTLEGLEPGKTYQVLVTWVADPANASSTTWTIADGSGGSVLLSISDVDQTELRPDAILGGQTWQSLAIVTATSGAMVVRLDAAGSSGRVVADAVAMVEVVQAVESGQNGRDGDVVLAAAATNDLPAKTWFGWLVDLLGGRFGKAESERFRARDQALADLQVESHPYANLPLRPQDIQAYDDATGIPVAGPIIQFTYGDMVRPGESRKAAANAGVQVAVGVTAKVLSAGSRILSSTAPLSRAGQVLDRNGLTRAGRALQKHGDRVGSVFPKSVGTAAQRNALGQEILDGILNSTSRSVKPNAYGGFDIWDNITRRGARYDEYGNFLGFLDP